MGSACFIVVGLAVAAIGIWFGAHFAKYPFVLFYCLAMLASIYLCFRQAPTVPRLILIATSAGMLQTFASWSGNRRTATNNTEERDPFAANLD